MYQDKDIHREQPLKRIASIVHFLYWTGQIIYSLLKTWCLPSYIQLNLQNKPIKTCLLIRALLLWINYAFLEQNDLLAKFFLTVFMPLLSSWYQRTWREGVVPDMEMLIRPPHMGLQSWSWHLLELLVTKLAFWASEILGIMTSSLPSWWDCRVSKQLMVRFLEKYEAWPSMR